MHRKDARPVRRGEWRNRPVVRLARRSAPTLLEREAVVVLHPLAGYREAPAFATDPGRLCVALSRHRSHATVICDVQTDAVLRHAQHEVPNETAVAIQRYVLKALLGTG